MKLIKNWKLFIESIKDSLEDIKWIIVDYDIVDYEYYPNSTRLLSFLVKDKYKVREEIDRIKGLSEEEGWNAIYNEALIFYKGDLEGAVLNWLDENYGDVNRETKLYKDRIIYLYKSKGKILFECETTNLNMTYIDAYRIFYELPLWCCEKDGNKTDIILKKWLKDNLDLNITNIFFKD